MSNDPISSEVSLRICTHMNRDHQEALITYAGVYGGVSDPVVVKMISINANSNFYRRNNKYWFRIFKS